jgi:hypothetical protein
MEEEEEEGEGVVGDGGSSSSQITIWQRRQIPRRCRRRQNPAAAAAKRALITAANGVNTLRLVTRAQCKEETVPYQSFESRVKFGKVSFFSFSGNTDREEACMRH